MEEFNNKPLFSYVLLGQISFYQIANYKKVNKIMGYWWKSTNFTTITPTSACDILNQHNKTGGITFRATVVY